MPRPQAHHWVLPLLFTLAACTSPTPTLAPTIAPAITFTSVASVVPASTLTSPAPRTLTAAPRQPTSTPIPSRTPAPSATPHPIEPPPTPTTRAPSLTAKYQVQGLEKGDVLNLRAAPGVENPIVGVIPRKGFGITAASTALQVADNAPWVQVQYRDLTGWVNWNYLAEQPDPAYGIVPGELAVTEFGPVGRGGLPTIYFEGEIYNATTQPLTDLRLTITVTNKATGYSLLTNAAGAPVPSVTFAPVFQKLLPGEYAPFVYTNGGNFYFENELEPDAVRILITVAGQPTAPVERATSLAVRNVQLSDCDLCELFTAYHTGELVNTGPRPVWINGLAGVLRGTPKLPVGFRRYLAPAGDPSGLDRLPFLLDWRLDSPAGDSPWAFALDTEYVAPLAFPVLVTTTYADDAHNVQQLTNVSAQPMAVNFVLAAYGAKGEVVCVMDLALPYRLMPGESLPLDAVQALADNWEAGNRQPSYTECQEEVVLPMSFTVQTDPSLMVAVTTPPIILTPTFTATFEAETVIFTGSLRNTSNQRLKSVGVVVGVSDAQGQSLTATAVCYTLDDPVAPRQELLNYLPTLYLPPPAIQSGLTGWVRAQGFTTEVCRPGQ